MACCLMAWHQAITWTNVDWSSVKSSAIHIRVISQEIPQPAINLFENYKHKISFKFPSGQWLQLLAPWDVVVILEV